MLPLARRSRYGWVMRIPDARLRLCATCLDAPEAARDTLQAALEAAGLSAEVTLSDCMNGCAHPASLALQGEGRATYFFSDVRPDADLADIVGTTRAYLAAERGWIEDATACGRLRMLLVGRVPAL
ncbi:DUF1636 family protein [Litorisediminicola beolgyonensis]|uniref:DUF1636 family protein n=1 Tax=Litorisediminicola beolgyonensis TaxID=1173614 RepID=A0ABW3ZGI0_9RHOB